MLKIPSRINKRLERLKESEVKETHAVGKYSNFELLERMKYEIVYSYNHSGGKQNRNIGLNKDFVWYSELLGSKELAESNIGKIVYGCEYEIVEELE